MLTFFLLISVPETPARKMIAETALAQAKSAAPDWHKQQRDCSGLIRYAYRSAFRRFGDSSAFNGFADAETLITQSFERVSGKPLAADVLAFRTEDEGYHLMLLVQGEDQARTEPLVVYSPGNGSDEVRVGTLHGLETEAPAEWRPLPSNPRFLGYFRYKVWGQQ